MNLPSTSNDPRWKLWLTGPWRFRNGGPGGIQARSARIVAYSEGGQPQRNSTRGAGGMDQRSAYAASRNTEPLGDVHWGETRGERSACFNAYAGARRQPPARRIQPIRLKANHFREIGFVCPKSEPSLGRAQFRTTAPNRA